MPPYEVPHILYRVEPVINDTRVAYKQMYPTTYEGVEGRMKVWK
jgi:hypothetical protein